MLQARILRALIVVTPVTISLNDEGGRIVAGDSTDLRSGALAALDRVLALDPKNAEAYYWKARTLMLSNPAAEEVGAEHANDPRPAIDAARTAVGLAPENSAYREYLALGLFGTGQTAEALEELGKLPGKHPVLQLFDDMKAIPTLEGAELEEDTYDLVSQIFSGHMDVFRYPGLRVRVQALPTSLAQAEAFYAGFWPGIRWVREEEDRAAMAGLVWREDRLEPVSDPAPFANGFDKQLPPSGVLLMISRDEEVEPAQTRLFVFNFRRF